MVTWHIDDSELVTLGLKLAGAPARIQFKGPKTLRTRVGPRLEREMKIDATGHKGNWFGIPGTSYITPLPQHVKFEMEDAWSLVCGIENEGAGKLANIIVLGSPRNAPAYDYRAGLRRTAPVAARMLADVAEESVLGESA